MRLVEPFGFLDSDQKPWQVLVGAKVDGASTPQPLRSIRGGPFEGKYRDASVVHDFYCDVRTEPWRAVHRVFYCAMRASGVSETRAKLMYAAVYFAGPRWSDAAVDNARLPRDEHPERLYSVAHSDFQHGVFEAVEKDGESAADMFRRSHVMWPSGRKTALHLDLLAHLIEVNHPTISEIEVALETAARVVERPPFYRTEDDIRVIAPLSEIENSLDEGV